MHRRNSVAVDLQQVRALSGEGQIPSLSRTDAFLTASGAAGQRGNDEADGANADAIGYAKPPFAGPVAVLAYLARYAIANSRPIQVRRPRRAVPPPGLPPRRARYRIMTVTAYNGPI